MTTRLEMVYHGLSFLWTLFLSFISLVCNFPYNSVWQLLVGLFDMLLTVWSYASQLGNVYLENHQFFNASLAVLCYVWICSGRAPKVEPYQFLTYLRYLVKSIIFYSTIGDELTTRNFLMATVYSTVLHVYYQVDGLVVFTVLVSSTILHIVFNPEVSSNATVEDPTMQPLAKANLIAASERKTYKLPEMASAGEVRRAELHKSCVVLCTKNAEGVFLKVGSGFIASAHFTVKETVMVSALHIFNYQEELFIVSYTGKSMPLPKTFHKFGDDAAYCVLTPVNCASLQVRAVTTSRLDMSRPVTVVTNSSGHSLMSSGRIQSFDSLCPGEYLAFYSSLPSYSGSLVMQGNFAVGVHVGAIVGKSANYFNSLLIFSSDSLPYEGSLKDLVKRTEGKRINDDASYRSVESNFEKRNPSREELMHALERGMSSARGGGWVDEDWADAYNVRVKWRGRKSDRNEYEFEKADKRLLDELSDILDQGYTTASAEYRGALRRYADENRKHLESASEPVEEIVHFAPFQKEEDTSVKTKDIEVIKEPVGEKSGLKKKRRRNKKKKAISLDVTNSSLPSLPSSPSEPLSLNHPTQSQSSKLPLLPTQPYPHYCVYSEGIPTLDMMKRVPTMQSLWEVRRLLGSLDLVTQTSNPLEYEKVLRGLEFQLTKDPTVFMIQIVFQESEHTDLRVLVNALKTLCKSFHTHNLSAAIAQIRMLAKQCLANLSGTPQDYAFLSQRVALTPKMALYTQVEHALDEKAQNHNSKQSTNDQERSVQSGTLPTNLNTRKRRTRSSSHKARTSTPQ